MTIDPKQPVDREPFAPVPPETASFPAQPVVPSTPAVQVQRRKSSGGLLNVILVVAAVVAVGGVAFAVGRGTAPVAAAGQRNGNFGGGNFPRASFAPGQSGAPGGGVGGRLGGGGAFNLSGTVQSVTADTLTITTANGQTLEFSLGASTTYDSKTPATASAVTPGSKVEVQLDFGGRPTASAAPSGPVGTATTVTVVP